MSEQAINYLKENKEKYSREVLVSKLLNTGYSKEDVEQSAAYVYENKPITQAAVSQQASFWDFKTKKEYNDTREKVLDFLLGFFGFLILNLILGFIPIINILFLIVEVIAIVYFLKVRTFISFGILGLWALGFLFTIIAILLIFSFSLMGARHSFMPMM